MEHFAVRVAKGESLLALCRRCGLAPERVIRDNYLTAEPEEGEVLYIASPPKRVHIAGAGESYADIARLYRMSEEKIAAMNAPEYAFWGLPVVIEE